MSTVNVKERKGELKGTPDGQSTDHIRGNGGDEYGREGASEELGGQRFTS